MDDISSDWGMAALSLGIAGASLYYTYKVIFGPKAHSAFPTAENEMQVATASSFDNGSMREVALGDDSKKKILLVKTKSGDFYATSSKCTHYGAPLVKGTLCDDRVMCPWHAACFNVKNGDIEDAPSLDALHSFPCRVENDKVIVSVPEPFPETHKRVPEMCPANPENDNRTFVIVGGGPAGLQAAETLRQDGFEGRIVIVSNEPYLPYDRTKLSKNAAAKEKDILLREKSFFEENNIEILLNTAATALDTSKKTVSLSKGSPLKYDSILIAVGGNARRLPGSDLENVHTLRLPTDAQSIDGTVSKDSKVVIVGSSFIGMEAAAYLKQTRKVDSITVVGMEKVPFERVLGAEIGAFFQNIHESKGISFRMEAVVKEFKQTNGKVSSVVLSTGEELQADLVVIGAGIICATSFLEGSLPLERDGSIIVDEYLKVPNADSVWIAGDIARFKYWQTGEVIRVEHWDVALQQGRVAAHNMVGKKSKFTTIPFFWTMQFGMSLRYAGNAMKWDDIVISGSLADKKFVAYFVLGSKVTAVATLGCDPQAVAASELFRTGNMPSAAQVKRNVDLLEYLSRV